MVKADELIKSQKKRKKRKEKIFCKVYKKIEKKITLASASNFYYCWYQIPEFILGQPLYSYKECIEYIKKIIENDGFKIEIYEPNIVLISWYPKSK